MRFPLASTKPAEFIVAPGAANVLASARFLDLDATVGVGAWNLVKKRSQIDQCLVKIPDNWSAPPCHLSLVEPGVRTIFADNGQVAPCYLYVVQEAMVVAVREGTALDVGCVAQVVFQRKFCEQGLRVLVGTLIGRWVHT